MGQVYEAELQGPAGFRKRVALKVLAPHVRVPERAEALLVREARLGGLLRHPNLVETYELGQADGRWFVAMELVNGPTLSQLVRPHGPLPPRAIFDLAVQLCTGLAHAHNLHIAGEPAGLVHRDLKPANVLLDAGLGLAKIADFGIASLRQSVGLGAGPEGVVGTPAYMSPEHLGSGKLTAASDQFALAAVLFYACRARRLFADDGFGAVSELVLDIEYGLDAVVAEVEQAVPGLGEILRRCLRVHPANRWGSTVELRDEMLRCQATAAGAALSELLGAPGRAPTMHFVPRTDLGATNVGVELDAFFGRGKEVTALRERFASGQRLVTLKGLGGSGKTRLSREFGRDVGTEWPGGVWFCDLTAANDRSGVHLAVGAALGVALVGTEQDIEDRVRNAIVGRGRVLLILDNFERVVSEAPQTVGVWLREAPEAGFLVTSRRTLDLRGEVVHELDTLSVDDGVALFRDRASQAVGDGDVIREIVERLECLPLAIELAAARIGMLSPTQLAARLNQRFRVLAGGGANRPRRHQTMRATVDWSWQLLKPWEQRALSQLALFTGGFFVEAAEAVLDLSEWPHAPWEVDVIASLLDRSLLVTRNHRGEPRFSMLETVREFALEQAGDAVSIRRRFYAYFEHFGEPGGGGPRSGPGWRARMEPDVPNLVLALDWAQADADATAAARTALAMAMAVERRGPHHVTRRLLERTLQLSGLPDVEHAALQRYLGKVQRSMGDVEAAGACFARSREIAERVGDRAGVARAVYELALQARQRGDYATCLTLLQDSIALLERLGDEWGLASALALMGGLKWLMGDTSATAEILTRALGVAERSKNLDVQAYLHIPLGMSLETDGRPEEALRHYRAAIDEARALGSRDTQISALTNLGVTLGRQGQWEQGRARLRESIALSSKLGERRSEGFALGNLASSFLKTDELSEARETYLRAAALVGEVDRLGQLTFVGGAAIALGMQPGGLEEARPELEETVRALEEMGADGQLGSFYAAWAGAEHRAGNLERRDELLALAEGIADARNEPPTSLLRRRIASVR